MSEGGQQVSETVVGGLPRRVVHVRKVEGPLPKGSWASL